MKKNINFTYFLLSFEIIQPPCTHILLEFIGNIHSLFPCILTVLLKECGFGSGLWKKKVSDRLFKQSFIKKKFIKCLLLMLTDPDPLAKKCPIWLDSGPKHWLFYTVFSGQKNTSMLYLSWLLKHITVALFAAKMYSMPKDNISEKMPAAVMIQTL